METFKFSICHVLTLRPTFIFCKIILHSNFSFNFMQIVRDFPLRDVFPAENKFEE